MCFRCELSSAKLANNKSGGWEKKSWLADKRGKVSVDIIPNACEHMSIDLK